MNAYLCGLAGFSLRVKSLPPDRYLSRVWRGHLTAPDSASILVQMLRSARILRRKETGFLAGCKSMTGGYRGIYERRRTAGRAGMITGVINRFFAAGGILIRPLLISLGRRAHAAKRYFPLSPFTRFAMASSCLSSRCFKSLTMASIFVGFLDSKSKNSLGVISKYSQI